jgi:hypothetical protein
VATIEGTIEFRADMIGQRDTARKERDEARAALDGIPGMRAAMRAPLEASAPVE